MSHLDSEWVERAPEVSHVVLDGDVVIMVGDQFHLLDPLMGLTWQTVSARMRISEVVDLVANEIDSSPTIVKEPVRDRIRALVTVKALSVES